MELTRDMTYGTTEVQLRELELVTYSSTSEGLLTGAEVQDSCIF